MLFTFQFKHKKSVQSLCPFQTPTATGADSCRVTAQAWSMLTLRTVPLGRTDGCPVNLHSIPQASLHCYNRHCGVCTVVSPKSNTAVLTPQCPGNPWRVCRDGSRPGSGLPIRVRGLGMCISSTSPGGAAAGAPCGEHTETGPGGLQPLEYLEIPRG